MILINLIMLKRIRKKNRFFILKNYCIIKKTKIEIKEICEQIFYIRLFIETFKKFNLNNYTWFFFVFLIFLKLKNLFYQMYCCAISGKIENQLSFFLAVNLEVF